MHVFNVGKNLIPNISRTIQVVQCRHNLAPDILGHRCAQNNPSRAAPCISRKMPEEILQNYHRVLPGNQHTQATAINQPARACDITPSFTSTRPAHPCPANLHAHTILWPAT
jgi:hypothetical protein